MSKFHVNGEGATGQCGAKEGNCPFGGDSGQENHYATKAEAEDAAQAMLSEKYGSFKTEKKQSGFVEPSFKEVPGYGRGSSGWRGSKRPDKYLPNKEVAKLIRKDIKDAISEGYLPKGLKVSTTSPDNSINMVVSGLGRKRDIYEYKMDKYGNMQSVLKPEHQEVVDRVQNIHSSYNYDTSNAQIDYVNVGYHGGVTLAREEENYEAEIGKAARNFNKKVAELRKGGAKDEDIKQLSIVKELDDKYYGELYRYNVVVNANQLADEVAFRLNDTNPNWEEIDKVASEKTSENLKKLKDRRVGEELRVR